MALAGGVGAAKFLAGLVRVVDPAEVTVVGNTGDDFVLHGLAISPDLDTVTYTLAGVANPETGWGLAGESFRTMEALERLGGESWFRLGDTDLATHLYRTGRLAAGASLSDVTAELAAALGLSARLLPMSDEPAPTLVHLARGEQVSFQEYFVHRRHAEPVSNLDLAPARAARPAPGVLAALEQADLVVVCPSNPLVSIAPIRAVAGVEAVLAARRAATVAVSPIVAGTALRGPADRLLGELGHEASATGVARLYAPIAATLVLDQADAGLAEQVEAAGMRAVVTDTIMRSPDAAAALARVVLEARSR